MEEIKRLDVPNLQFGKEDVLSDLDARKIRRAKLEKGLALGNLHKGKVKMYIRVADGSLKRLETTIWGVGQEYINLKDGVNVPIKAIEDVDFS